MSFRIGGSTYNLWSLNNELSQIGNEFVFLFDMSKRSVVYNKGDGAKISRSYERWQGIEFRGQDYIEKINNFEEIWGALNSKTTKVIVLLPEKTIKKKISKVEKKEDSHRIVLHF